MFFGTVVSNYYFPKKKSFLVVIVAPRLVIIGSWI